MKRRGTIYALTWGRDTMPETADRFAAMVDADFFITGHQPCDEGFRQANHRQIIIDGTKPYPAYCLFPADQPVTIESLVVVRPSLTSRKMDRRSPRQCCSSRRSDRIVRQRRPIDPEIVDRASFD